MKAKSGKEWAKIFWLAVVSLLSMVVIFSCEQTTGPGKSDTTSSQKLLIYSDASMMPSNGGTSNILVKVYSENDTTNVVSNVRVQFATNFGSVQIQNEITDAGGYARAIAYGGSKTGSMAVTASIENYSNTIFITVTAGAGLVSAAPSEILANGSAQSTITAAVIDSLGQPVPGALVRFVTTSGVITAQSYSNELGRAEAVLRSVPSATDISATVTATTATGKIAEISSREDDAAAKTASTQEVLGTTTVVFKGITVSGTVGKTTVFANNADSTLVNISVKETTSGAAVPDAALSFTSTLGNLRSSSGKTDSEGNTSVVLFGANVSGVAVVNATLAEGLAYSTEISLTKQLFMSLMSSPSSLAANGSDISTIKAQITDADGNPVQGEVVYFTSTLGTIQPSAETDLWGYAEVELRSPRQNGVAEVSAKYQSIEKVTDVEFKGAELKVQATPMILVANDTDRSTITLTLTDASGIPVVDSKITLTTSMGLLVSADGKTSGTSVTDSTSTAGKITVYLKSGEPGDAVINISGSGIIETVTVNFTDYTFSLSSSDSKVLAGGGKVNITATLFNKNGVVTPINMNDVTFSSTLGTIVAVERTADGRVVAELTSGNSAGTATVTASMKEPPITSSLNVPFVAADADSVIIKADQISVQLGGSTIDIRATVYDVTGNPKEGETVTFSILKGPGGGEEITPGSAVTNDRGQAVVTFKSGTRGSDLDGVEIQAKVGDHTSNILKLTIAGEPYSVIVGFGSSYSANSDGTYGVNVSAIVSDVNRNKVIDNTIVNFSITSGDVGIIEGQVPTVSGVASTILIYMPSDAGKEIEITASSGGIIDKKPLKLPGVAGTVGDLKVSPEESSILADGISVSSLSVYLTGMTGEPLSNQTVYCELLPNSRNMGKIDPTALTGDPTSEDSTPGKAIVIYTSAASVEDRQVGIRIYSGDKADTVFVNLMGITVSTSADPETLPPDGQSHSTINVLVKETTSNVPISSGAVRFGASHGYIGGKATTDAKGVAQTTFTAPKDTSVTSTNYLTANILVSYGSKLEVTVPVTIREIRTQGLELFSSPTQIPANGSSTSTITALLRDNNSNPVVGEIIRFTTDLGTITAMDSTDANGRAEAILVSDRSNGQAHVTAIFKNTTRTIPVNFTGVKLSVSATPENLFAGGDEETTVTAFVKDAAEVAIVGETVSFNWSLNGESMGSETVETDVTGRAQVSLSATEAGDCVIRVSAAGTSDSTTVTFNRIRLLVGGNAVTATDSLSVSTGGDSIQVWAQLYDTVNERYITGTSIEFYTTLGSIGKNAVTNSQGVATTYLVSGNTAGTATVLATTTYQGQRVSKEKQFTFVPSDDVGKVTLTVDPNIISVGGAGSALVAVVSDKYGNPISDALVSFKLLQGPAGGEFIHPITSTTGTSGIATTYFYSGQVPSAFENVHFQAEVNGVSSNTAKLTIAGAPETIQPSYPTLISTTDIDNGNGTFTLPVSASVLDINSNYVVDGTTVYFKIDPPEGAVLSPVKTVNSVASSQITYPATSAGKTVVLTASAGGKEGKISIPLPGFTVSYLSVVATPTTIPADGKTTSTIKATIFDNTGSSAFVPDGITVSFTTDGGVIDPVVATTENGVATAVLTSDKTAKMVSITAQSGTSQDIAYVTFEEVGVSVNQVADIQLSLSDPIIEADGSTASEVTATLYKFNGDVVDTPTTVEFATDIGEITQYVRSDTEGKAVARFTSGVMGTATISATVGNVVNYTNVIVVPGDPQSIQLSFSPTTVGVQKSGRNETLLIKADVMDNKNNPVADGVLVKFELVGSHDDAVSITPSGETAFESEPVATVNGTATVSFHSGTRAGAVRVKATVIDSTGAVSQPLVSSETTQFLVISGPAFLDTSDLNDPFTNSRVTVAGGPLNIYAGELGTEASMSTIRVMIADRYNNPVPEGTAVYFTTTGGSIDSRTGFTDAQGMATVTLYAGNPFPTLLNSNTIDNPNQSLGGVATFTMSDYLMPLYDFDGDGNMNNGVAIVTAYTQGMDQENREVSAWNYVPIVFSRQVSVFTVVPAENTLLNGRSTEITVTVYDTNGNPIVGGSTLEFSTALGSLSTSKITTNSPGTTEYTFTLTNNLDPINDTPGNTVVTVKLTSSNGEVTKTSIPIYMSTSTL